MDWGAVIQAVGNLGTAALNYGANERTNSTNRYMNRENNEWNERLWREQLQWNEDMYNKYQSPEMQLKSQMKAMQELGLNPNLMFGHAAGSAGGVAGATPPQMVASRDVAPQIGLDLSPLAKFGLNDAQRDNLQASTDAQLIKNRFAVLREIFTLREKLAEYDKDSTQSRFLRQELREAELNYKYQEEMLQARNDLAREDVNYRTQQARLTGLQADSQEIVNYYAPQLNQATLKRINAAAAASYAESVQAYADAGYKGQLSASEITKRTLLRAEREGVKLSNEEQGIVNSYLDEEIRLGIASMEKHVRQQGQDYWNPFRYAGQILGGAAAGSMAAGIKNSGARTVVRGFVP